MNIYFDRDNMYKFNIIEKASKQARKLNNEYIGTEHIILAMLDNKDSYVKKSMNFKNVNYNKYINKLKKMQLKDKPRKGILNKLKKLDNIMYNREVYDIFNLILYSIGKEVKNEFNELSQNTIKNEVENIIQNIDDSIIFTYLLKDNNNCGVDLLTSLVQKHHMSELYNMNLQYSKVACEVRNTFINLVNEYTYRNQEVSFNANPYRFKINEKALDKFPNKYLANALMGNRDNNMNKKDIIDKYCTNLNDYVKTDRYDGVMFRDRETQSVIESLMCRRMKNVILTGKAGVGKTAIVQNVAERINEKEVPKRLSNKQIYSLDINCLLAGTTLRGQFEERLQEILKIFSNDENKIMFIDEIHMIKGTGKDVDAPSDMSNIMKQYLSNGDLQVIGATTNDEYKKYISGDKALTRRFRTIEVTQLSKTNVIEILYDIKSNYQEYHDVKVSNDVLDLIVDVSDDFVYSKNNEKCSLDLCIDILDEYCVKKSIEIDNDIRNSDEDILSEIFLNKGMKFEQQERNIDDNEICIEE